MIGDGNMDREIAAAMIILALALVVWAITASIVRARGRSVPGMVRRAKRVVKERDIERFHPTLRIYPDRAHALIEWTEDGHQRAILLTWHHVLDNEHSHESPTRQSDLTSQQMHESEED